MHTLYIPTFSGHRHDLVDLNAYNSGVWDNLTFYLCIEFLCVLHFPGFALSLLVVLNTFIRVNSDFF